MKVLAAFALLVSMPHPSKALAQVALEQYSDTRPEEADDVMTLLRHELALNHVVSYPENVARSLFYAPRPAIADAALTSAALIDELELASKSYIKVEYDAALVQLTSALAHAEANYGLLVEDAKAKSAMSRAQVALALTYKKLSERQTDRSSSSPKDGSLLAARKEFNAKANEAMATYIRSSREPVVRRMFGPPGEILYNEVRKALDATKRASLVVNVSEPDAEIYVNGLLVGRGATFAADQLPGPYCIIVRVQHRMLRYNVTVADRPVVLDIDWSFDSVLNVSPRWVGLVQPKLTAANAYVQRVSLRMGGEISLIFIGMRRERSYLAVYGYRYERAYRGGDLRRSGEVHIVNASNAARLRELAQFLASDIDTPNIVPVGSIESSPADRDLRRRWPAWAAAAGSVATLAAGTYFVYRGKNACGWGDVDCSGRPYEIVGFTALDLGVVLGAASAYWYLRPKEVPAKWLVFGGATMVAAGAVLYAYDEDPSPGPTAKAYYWDTAPAGVALGSLGLASIGVGVWHWTRAARVTSVPTLSVSSSRALLGWAGAF